MSFLPVPPLYAVLFAMLLLATPQKETPKAPRHNAEPKYDVAAVVDFIVTIQESRDVTTEPLKGRHLIVIAPKGSVDVYLAPTEFLKFFDLPFFTGQRIHVIGAMAKPGGAEVMLAREVRWNSSSLLLRDRQGEPIWKTWMPRK